MHSHIEKYFTRFRNLLGPGNRRYIQTLMVLTRAFLQTLDNKKDLSNVNNYQAEEIAADMKAVCDTSIAINDFLFSLNIDNINLVKLLQYIKESNLVHKVNDGYPFFNLCKLVLLSTRSVNYSPSCFKVAVIWFHRSVGMVKR